MKFPRFFAAVLLLASTGIVGARVVRMWSDQELFDKSELVVLATPTTSNDTKEHGGHPNRDGQPVIGVETTFEVSAVLKGEKAIKDLILHHYRPDKMELPNAPTFLAFDIKAKRTFRLFLVRQADGRYAPVAGQTDPDMSIRPVTKI